MVGDAGQPYSRKIKNLGGRLDSQIITRFCGFLNVVSNLQFTDKTPQPKSSFVALPKYLVESLAWRGLKPVPRPAFVELLGFNRTTKWRRATSAPALPSGSVPKKQTTASSGSHVGQC
jgi:hypothetical protein